MLSFDNNYNSERTIKKWAKFLLSCVYILWGLSVAASLILLLVNIRFWWISLTIIGSVIVISIPAIISSHLIWGFGEIVGNSKKMIGGNEAQNNSFDAALPEL